MTPAEKYRAIWRCHPYERKCAQGFKVRLVDGSSMQPTLHATCWVPHGASRLLQAIYALPVNTRRDPFRDCRDVRVLWSYGDGHAWQWLLPPPPMLCGVDNLEYAQAGWSYHALCMWPGTYDAVTTTYYTHCCLCKWPHRKQLKSFDAVIHMQDSVPNVAKSSSQAVLSRMQLTLHANRPTPYGALHLVQATPAWSVETRRGPCRHCPDARVCQRTTTAMQGNEYTCRPTTKWQQRRMPSL